MKKLLILAIFLAAPALHAQTQIAAYAADPATCSTTRGLLYWNTATLQMKTCTATNTWTALGASGGNIGGSIAANQVAFGSGANAIQGNADFTFNETPSPLLIIGATNGGSFAIGDSHAHQLEFQVPFLSSSYTIIYPTTGGSSGQFLTSGGVSGQLTWTGLTANQVAFGSSTNTMTGDADFTWDTVGKSLSVTSPAANNSYAIQAYNTGTVTGATGPAMTAGFFNSNPTLNSPNTNSSYVQALIGALTIAGNGTWTATNPLTGTASAWATTGASTIANIASYTATTPQIIGGATITSNYGYWSSDQSNLATTNYAFFAAPLAAATGGHTNYAFYNATGQSLLDKLQVTSVTAAGTTAGFVDLVQGTSNAGAGLCNTANSICEQAPTSVSSTYTVTKPGTIATGIITNNVSGAVDTQALSGDANHSTTVSWSTATTIASTQLCSAANCPAGLYDVHVYIDVTTACTTTGAYVINLIYTDDQGAKTIPVNIQGTGTTPSTGTLVPTSTADFGQAVQVIRLTSGNLNYSSTATACGTGGPGVGKFYLAVNPVMP